jgi:hypothetical protein
MKAQEFQIALEGLGETHLAHQRSADLLQKNGDNFHNVNKLGKCTKPIRLA